MLNQIKNLLGVELSETEKVELEEMKLENGTILEAESFESGKEIFIKTDDEKVALPIGEYDMEDGRILVIAEEGIISEIKDKSEEESEEVVEEEATKEEELSEEIYASKDEISELKAMIEDLKSKLELKDQETAEEIGLAMTTMLSEQEQLKEALSKPAAEPIKHNPEGEKNKMNFTISKNRTETTLDRVMKAISNN